MIKKQLALPQNRGFSLDLNEVNRLKENIRGNFQTLSQRLIDSESELKSDLEAIEYKIKLERERKRQEQIVTIKKIQDVLASASYYSSRVDGILGPGTQKAIDQAFSDFDARAGEMSYKGILNKLETVFLNSEKVCTNNDKNSLYSLCMDL